MAISKSSLVRKQMLRAISSNKSLLSFHIHPLRNRHRGEVLKLLLSDIPTNLFLIDILFDRGIHTNSHEEWVGAFQGETLVALVVSFGRTSTQPSRLLVTYGDVEACRVLGRHQNLLGTPEMIVGERQTSDALAEAFAPSSIRIRYDQHLYMCTSVRDVPQIPIRFAKEKDEETILNYSAQMIAEDLQENPMERHPERFTASVRSKILRNKCLVGEQEGEICYIIDIGTQFRLGCQLGGTYVPPKFRGQGISTKATAAVCHLMLSLCDCVTLHVHEKNIPAIRCYEGVGFHPVTPFRLLSFQGAHHAQ